MALFESAPKILHKDEIISLALVYQSKFIRSGLSVTKLVNTKLNEKVVSLERQA